MQDGTFSYADFAEAFQEIEVKRVVRAYENGISIDIHCSPEGEWAKLPKESFTKACKVRVNPTDVLTSGSLAITDFGNYLAPFLIPASLENLLESSDVVGNIRFSRPTLYIFPGGQGKEIPNVGNKRKTGVLLEIFSNLETTPFFKQLFHCFSNYLPTLVSVHFF